LRIKTAQKNNELIVSTIRGHININTDLTQVVGDKHYELSNLPTTFGIGNVLQLVTDRKLAVDNGEYDLETYTYTSATPDGIIDYFTSDVVSQSDYYPFGMMLPGRNSSEEEYRYGYQGSEMDNEVKDSKGTSYTTHFRLLDSRIGKWMSVDPKSQEMCGQSPYCSMNNNPIVHNDILGDIVKKERGENVTRKEFREFKQNIRFLRRNSESFNAMYKDFKNSDKTFIYRAEGSTLGGCKTVYEGDNTIMKIGIQTDWDEGQLYTQLSLIAHETGHAWRDLHNLDSMPPVLSDNQGVTLSKRISNNSKELATYNQFTEREAMHIENIVRSELGKSRNKNINGIPLAPTYRAGKDAVLSRGIDGKYVYKIIFVDYEVLQSPRDKEYYYNTAFDLHRDFNVKPVER
jgi:RHS repeat-associated protein